MVRSTWLSMIAGLVAGCGALATDEPPPRVALLELYTSEGCNSCPPADRWVSNLPRPFVPDRLVVLAFHVDYWNNLGWVDRFSQRRFTERQQALVRANRLRTAYTPQRLLNGRDYRGYGSVEADVAHINRQRPAVRLMLDARPEAAVIRVSASAVLVAPASAPAALYVAVYENNLATDVRAGENRGRRLRHDYVVRTLLGPFPVAAGRETHWTDAIPVARDWKTGDLGVAAFVQSDPGGEVLQAVARRLQ